jgi:hypothetical protein
MARFKFVFRLKLSSEQQLSLRCIIQHARGVTSDTTPPSLQTPVAESTQNARRAAAAHTAHCTLMTALQEGAGE